MAAPTQGMNITQAGNSQASGTQRARTSIDAFIKDFVTRSNKVGNKAPSDVEQRIVTSVRGYYRQLLDDRRRGKVFDHVDAASKKDEGTLLGQFVVAWLNLLRLIEDDVEVFRSAILRLLFRVLEHCHVNVHSFVSLYNTLTSEVSKCDTKTVLTPFDDALRCLQKDGEITKRWKDCILVLVCHISNSPRITVEGVYTNGSQFCADLLYDWLGYAASPTAFRHVVSITKGCDQSSCVPRFLSDRLLDLIADEHERVKLSWKAICLLEVVETKMTNRLLRALCTVWPVSADTPAADLIPIVSLFVKTCEEHPTVAKMFANLFKHERGMLLTSEFGFLSIVALCGVDRYKANMLLDLKRTIHKLWKFDGERAELGWLATTSTANVADGVRVQCTHLVDRMTDETSWKLLGSPLIHLSQSLLECTASKEIMIVDGRVADGCPLWLFAKDVMTKSLMNQPAAIPSQLMLIVHAISSSGASGAALVLIDVLVEIVKKCALEVLNNWKLLEGLFDYVCKMRRDVAVSLIRCLLPVINNRSQLREALFRSLKKDMLGDSTVGSAVPILLLLLRSVSQKRAAVAQSQGQMSQSFATFSTQTLSDMGLKRSADDTVGLEVIGFLKKCLSQPASTRAALYQGMAEAASRSSTMVVPCLDMLVTHAASAPAWTPETMVVTSKTATHLKEAMPQLVQALECLSSEAMASAGATSGNGATQQSADQLVASATRLVAKWVAKAAAEDVHDLGVDKLSEWNPTSSAGRANLVFAHMMISLYDTLVEHVWKRVTQLKRSEDKDQLIALMKRRRELNEVLSEKTVRRKEAKIGSAAVDASSVNIQQGEVFTSARTIAQILERIVPGDSDTEDIVSVRDDLLSWAIERAYILSQDLLRCHHPLHSLISSAGSLTTVASLLLEFYLGVECAEWLRDMETDTERKTQAMETYANIIRYLSTKYRCQPARVVAIWQKEPLNGSTSSAGAGSAGGVNGSLVRHVHLIMSKMYPAVLVLDRRVGEERRKASAELEKQARAMLKISESLLAITTNPKAYSTSFKFVTKMMEKNTFASNAILRELVKFVSGLAMRCRDGDNAVSRTLNTVAEELLAVLSDEDDDQQKYAFISAGNQSVVFEFLMQSTDRLLTSIRNTVQFASEFFTKDNKLDDLICCVLVKCDESCDVISRLLPLHTQFHMHKERIAQLLTGFFAGLEAPVELLLNNVKTMPEMTEWKCIEQLATLLKRKIQAIMAIVDENVGCLNPDEEKQKRCNKKTRYAKSRRDENTYVKYVRARESFQSRVLLLCKALKDDRLDLQIKNNSIGLRDFRIDLRVLKERMAQVAAEESSSSSGQPARKRRKKNTEEGEEGAGAAEETRMSEQNENEEAAGDDEEEEGSAVY